jgi:hypothetical protein
MVCRNARAHVALFYDNFSIEGIFLCKKSNGTIFYYLDKKKYVWYPQGHNARSKFFFVVDSEAVPGGTAGYNT